MEVGSISQPPPQTIEQIDGADLLIGVLAGLAQNHVAAMYDALRTLPGSPRIVVLQTEHPVQSEPAAPVEPEASELTPQLSLVPWPLQNSNAQATPVESVSAAYESIFSIGEKLEVRGCCLIASKFEDATPQWIRLLAEPLFDKGYDLVAPCYSHRMFEGLLNSSIVSPLMRCLYGKRIQNPMGPDLSVSRRLFQRVLAADRGGTAGNGMHLLASLAPQACCDGDFQVCQAYLGTRVYPPVDWTDASALLTGILGPVFLAMEKNAPLWQSKQYSEPVIILNGSPQVESADGAFEIARLVNSFQLGTRNLEDVWGMVLPPATLLELRRMSRLPPEEFRMPDEVWVRIIYDFALAHRLRTINRVHLLRSLTPLYLGWVASYAREVEAAGAPAVDRRLERLSIAFETAKPYLISRWRWPDRFNP